MTTLAAPADRPVLTTLWRGPLAGPSWGMVALIAIMAFEQLAVATVMPGVADALHGSTLYAAAFGAAVAASVLGMSLAGRWCDRAGPGTPLAAGVGLFVAGLLVAALAPTMAWLVAGRALQGAGGGLASVSLYVVIGRHYPAALHARMFAAFAAAWVLPAIVGPALAGWIAAGAGWRWVFAGAAGLALPALLRVQRGLAALLRVQHGLAALLRVQHGLAALPAAVAPVPRRDAAPAPWWPAAGVSLGAGLLYLGRPGEAGALLGPAAGLALLAWAAPRLLPAGSLRAQPGLPAVIALRGLLAAAFLAAEVVIPLTLASWRGLSAVQAGLALTLGALGWSLGSTWQARLRPGTELARLRGGLLLLAAGIAAMAGVLWPAVPVPWGVAGWMAAGVGIGLAFPTLSVLTLRLAPAGQQGQASSALQLSDATVTAVALAGVGALLSAWPVATTRAGCAAAFALAAALALAGAAIAGRCVPQTPR